ncbi:hypothetical protein OHB12_00430 [Nocardia sp. NBC_01730]|nr:hypothetical protein OHB12_00430 [Nocardia sp. NBC_01730]
MCTYTRPSTAYGSSSRPRLQTDNGATIYPESAEHDAFWSWATVEVLRHTGIRIEELLELPHHSIQPYRQPNGTIVPLLQIAPSKTDTERVIPAGPELASVLAKVIARVAGDDGAIALVSCRDEHERSWSQPMPYLFHTGWPDARAPSTPAHCANTSATPSNAPDSPRRSLRTTSDVFSPPTRSTTACPSTSRPNCSDTKTSIPP